jgi:hypothetical protein
LPSEADCRAAAVDAVSGLQAFIDEYEDLTAEEWNALDPPPDIDSTQDAVVEAAQAAVVRGCEPVRLEELLGEAIDDLEGQSEVGRAIAAALRGDGPILGPPPPVPVTTIPRDTDPSTVVLEPGDDLDEVLARIAPGSTIEFAAGTHEFGEPIIVGMDVRFEGAGRDETIISSSAEGVAIAFVGPGGFELRDMTVEHTGDLEASVLLAIQGPVLVDGATITGGKSGESEVGGGHGIVFAFEPLPGFPERTDEERRGALAVTDTIVADNAAAGILMTGGAEPRLADVTVTDNGGCGLCYTGTSAGTAARATIDGNEIGVQASDSSAPSLFDSTIVGNAAVGVSIDGSSELRVVTTLIEGNGEIGVQIIGDASPTIRRNTINEHGVGVIAAGSATPTLSINGIANQEIGIQAGGDAVVEASENTIWVSSVAAASYGENSSGVFEANAIANAPDVGVQVVGQASVDILANIVETEGTVGISFADESTGAAIGNTVLGREIGIQIGGSADPDITENTVTDSIAVGILFGDQAKGRATANEVSGAETVGILAGGTSDPQIVDNLIAKNAVGLVFRENAVGLATGNTIEQHAVGVQVVDAATPTLESNDIVDSLEAGAVFGGSSAATFEGNTMARNGNISIQVGETAQPRIANNEMQGEGVYGLLYRDSGGGVASGNRIINHVFGIQLNDSVAPDLIGNSLEEIALTSIVYADNAGGSASGNACTESFSAGISVTAPANPTLTDNDCSLSRSA